MARYAPKAAWVAALVAASPIEVVEVDEWPLMPVASGIRLTCAPAGEPLILMSVAPFTAKAPR